MFLLVLCESSYVFNIRSSSINIVKYQECKRERYKDSDGKYGFLTTPKVFADYRNFTKDQYGNNIVDQKYDYLSEIQRQMTILHKDSS